MFSYDFNLFLESSSYRFDFMLNLLCCVIGLFIGGLFLIYLSKFACWLGRGLENLFS